MKYIVTLIIAILAFGILYAQAKNSNPPNKKQIKVYADDTSIPYGDKNKNIALKGNVTITHEDITVTSDYVEYNKEKNIANSPNKITMNSKNADITADKGTGDFTNKLCKAQGNVSGLIKRNTIEDIKNEEKRKDAEKEITEDIQTISSYAEYDYKNKIITLKGAVTIKEKKRTITAENVTYNINTEIFHLNGNVQGTDENNQTFSSPGEVIVSVKDGNEYIKAPKANTTFFVDSED